MGPSLPSRDAPFVRAQTALLLVDMQRIWLTPGADPAHPDKGPDDYFYRRTATETIPNARRLLQAARDSGIEVLHTIIQSLTEDGRDRSLDHKLTPIHIPPSSPDGLPVEALSPVGDEIVLPKTSSGVFNSTNIDYVLRNLGVRQLIVCGIMTDQCVDMAVRDAADKGYLVACVADACAAATQEQHDTALRAFGGYCWVSNTDAIIERLETMGDR